MGRATQQALEVNVEERPVVEVTVIMWSLCGLKSVALVAVLYSGGAGQ